MLDSGAGMTTTRPLITPDRSAFPKGFKIECEGRGRRRPGKIVSGVTLTSAAAHDKPQRARDGHGAGRPAVGRPIR